ncbi:galectin-3-binding protein A-like [Trichomycterus rosablanca]|uniref:galectin-3-binding protein A-like n=1 Tax=Trichomycterus rosablanca TaxID=2290929 RepID=UPI002F359AA8
MLQFRTSYVISFLLSLDVSAQRWNLFDVQAKRQAQEGGLRLVGSDQPFAGRVELYHDEQWGTICDDNWDLAEAKVVCQQLGFPGAVSAPAGGTYGQGSGPIWLDDVSCKGSESFLSSCHFKGWGVTDCSHKEDAGVVCEQDKTMDGDSTFAMDHSLGLSKELGALFDSQESCDFSILVHDPSEEQSGQQTICAHRLILSLFPRFNITNRSTNLSLEINQVCHPHVSSFFRYLYTRKIDVTITSAQCLHQLAHMFGLQQLLEDVGRVFIQLLPQDSTFRTQVSLYEYGVRTKDLMLQENVLQYLSWNFEFLVITPVWNTVSIHIMEALLSRSDLVVSDEAFVLQALEDWIKDKGDAVSAELRVDLLGHIRFSMIPAEKLYDIQFNSSMYNDDDLFYSKALMKGFQFNSLSFSKIRKHFNNIEDYLPRVYIAEPWSTVINYTSNSMLYNYHNYNSRSFSTPVHNSAIYKQQIMTWNAHVYLHSWECSNSGLICNSFPVVRLYNFNHNNVQDIIRFSNMVILTCINENIVFHVQDFKNDRADIPTNSSMGLPNPCPDNYSITFVVRPEYI